MADFTVNGKRMDDSLEVQLFGSRFEQLGQDRRVDVLKGFGLIDDEQKKHFDDVRVTRRRYLHFFSQSHDSIEMDAPKTFNAALALVVTLMDVTFEKGKVRLRPPLMRFVRMHEKA